MFSLFYGLWKYVFTKDEFRVLILGVDKAGKTTLLEKLKSIYLKGEGLPPDRVVPTVGLNIGRMEDANAKLVFWDLGGQVGLRAIWEKYYEEAHAIMYVIDAATASSFEDAKSALDKVIRHEHLRGAPLLIVANKQVMCLLPFSCNVLKHNFLYAIFCATRHVLLRLKYAVLTIKLALQSKYHHCQVYIL